LHIGQEWNQEQFRKWLGPLAGRERVLDYGCGLGRSYQKWLSGAAKSYVGADVAELALADLQRKGLSGLKINPASGSLDCPADSFDGATCVEVFEHLFDPLAAAREIHRTLKPGGVLVATVPNFGYHAWRMLALLRAQVPLEPEKPLENRFKGVHIRFFSKRVLKRLLSDAGFSNIRIGSFGEASVWDVFQATGPFAVITSFARKHFPPFARLTFLQDVWPNVFAERLRAVAWKTA
jgi:SAM-dependent methyltransferase